MNGTMSTFDPHCTIRHYNQISDNTQFGGVLDNQTLLLNAN